MNTKNFYPLKKNKEVLSFPSVKIHKPESISLTVGTRKLVRNYTYLIIANFTVFGRAD